MSVVVVHADEVNLEHRLARESAETAVKHAIRCGELLIQKKAALPHGEFMPWVESACEFKYSTAARYMRAARESSTGVEISTLSHLFPSGRVGEAEVPKADGVPEFGHTGTVISRAGHITMVYLRGRRGWPVAVLWESREQPGYWFDINWTHGSASKRPIRADALQRLIEAQHPGELEYSHHPDDGRFDLGAAA